jgi:monothiol glutaredoxin
MPDIALTISPAAMAALKAAAADEPAAIRLRISERFEHDLAFETPSDGDQQIVIDGLTFLLDRSSATRANGLTIDYVDGAQGPGFTITNPNQPPRVVQLSALELKSMRDRGDTFELVDVRTPEERATASIDGSRLLDGDYHKALLRLDHDTPLVFQCHHGVRSQAAAEYFVQAGFRKVFNLRGGIDAWSMLVDSAVPRY